MPRQILNKILIVIVLIGLISVFKIFGFGHYLSLSYIKDSQEKFSVIYANHTNIFITGYMLIYILVVSLSLPGATVMTLAGGAFFGLWIGTIVVSFSSTIGATLAASISRFLMRDLVQSKFADKLSLLNNGIDKEGTFYLFTLRLIPVFPFFVINLVAGLTRIPLFTFYWVSQIGMLPGTIVFVNAGKELAKIESLSGILSPGLVISFILLGLFPIVAKKTLEWYKR